MTNTQKTKKELLIEKKANDDLLDVSSDQIKDNKSNIEKTYNEIIAEQCSAIPNLPEEKKTEMADIFGQCYNKIDYLKTEISKLNIDDAKSEITETLLNRSITNTYIENTKKWQDVLGPIANELGQNYKELVQKLDGLDETNKTLVDNHLELTNKNIELNKSIDNKGSLLEDFADTSVNMPSYMDPED